MTGFPKLQNRLRGRKANTEGKIFENLFLIAARSQGVAVSRIQDGCKRLRNNAFVALKQPFDWVISMNGLSALIDTKSVAGNCFPCSGIVQHQLNELSKHAEEGAIAGYVVHARKTKEFYFIPAEVLLVKSRLSRGSISGNEPGVVHLGSDRHPNLAAIFQSHVERILKEVREEANKNRGKPDGVMH